MKKVELLSPVGNKEMLYQAVSNGADAVYLAGTSYGARKYAANFNDEELIKAISYCHLYGVKVYVTVNTLIYESEIEVFLEYIEFLYKNAVDALIMQDIGLISIVRKIFPELEIHASTQCHNHNEEVVKIFKDLGVKRVVLARELSLNEINKINVDIEKEVFVYGALCVSYSGCCLFSSLNGGRSGNRGECVGSCRLPYKLIKNNTVIDTKGEYLLSTREVNTIDKVYQLLASNIDSFKIEGRMKTPSYVGYVTRLYRKLIDSYYDNKNLKITSEELTNLKKLYNREFTNGYLFNDNNIMNIKTPNHQGIELGYVLDITKKYIKIKLVNDNINQNDGIRFKTSNKGMIINRLYNDKLLLTNSVAKDNIIYLDNKFKVKEGEVVLKTLDSKLVTNLEETLEKKIPISFNLKCLVNNNLELTIRDSLNKVTVYGGMVESSINREVTKEDIIKRLSKLGDTPFKLDSIDILKDNNIFINLKDLNEIRRDAVSKLSAIRSKREVKVIKNTYLDNTKLNNLNSKINISILVRTEEQLKVCLANNIASIYVTDYNLYLKYKDNNSIYYRLNRVGSNYNTYKNSRLLVTELGSINKYNKYKDNNYLIGDYYLNITNHHSINYLLESGLKRVCLSPELKKEEINKILIKTNNVELIIYGRLELMVMKYCPLKLNLNYCNECKNSKDKFYLENTYKELFPIDRDNCINHILDCKVVNLLSDIKDYYNMGIRYFRIELFDEDKEEVQSIINKLSNS